jgi:hypothetical protein
MKLMLFGLLIATLAGASATVSGQAQRPATTRPDPMLVKMADAPEQQQREGDTSIVQRRT